MKLKALLIALTLAFFSCEKEQSDIIDHDIKNELTSTSTRSVKSITQLAMNPIQQIEDNGIPIHIMLSEASHPYRYLSCTKAGKVDLYNKDDNSGRQKWIYKNAYLRPVSGVSGDISRLTVTGHPGSTPKLAYFNSFPPLYRGPTSISNIFSKSKTLYQLHCLGLIKASNYTSSSLSIVENNPLLGNPAPESPLNYFLIIPVEEFTLLDISYDFLTGDTFSTEPKKLIRRGFRNNSTEPVTRVLKIQESLTNSSTFQETYGLTVSTTVKGTVEVGLPKIVGGNVDASQTTTKEWKYSTTQTETRNFTIEESFTQTIPPGGAVDFRLVWSEYKINLTYIAKLQGKTTGTIIYLPGRWDGVIVEDCTIEAFNPDNQSTIATRSISKE